MKSVWMNISFLISIFLFVQISGEIYSQQSDCRKAPDFTLPDMNGKEIRLADWIGKKIIVINFWATWCTPCLEEMKAMIPIYEKYKNRGLEIISISIDDNKTAGRVPGFVHARKYPYIILLDTNNDVMRLYNVTMPPFTAIIDRDGCLIYTHTGYRKGDEKNIEAHLARLLPEE